ncbi:MAG: hypothetical protein J2P41_14710 [Blastocatellia bacterium]|nr:hypothetical protein [Blastocatellia bacterium]
MGSAYTRMHVYDRKDGIPGGFRAAASLHCHTYHSKEVMTFIPHYAEMIPFIASRFRKGMERHLFLHGKSIDFSKAYWTPPVSPRQVIEIETLQIEKELGLPALVSITDHDDIEAGKHLQVLTGVNRIPISLEWTVPYGRGMFHLGIHNLSDETSTDITRELNKYTLRDPDAMSLTSLLSILNESSETMIIVNHPLWDIEGLGEKDHAENLHSFLTEHGQWIHALEVNGFRSWSENRSVMRLAEDWGVPAVGGGDRHGCRPNTVLNLTRASSFNDLVAEIREDAHSEILLMPEYRAPFVARTFETIAEVLRFYPNHSLGQTRWVDRVFADIGDGHGVCPLSRFWGDGGPGWLRATLWCMRVLGSSRMQTALRLALAHEKVVTERMGYES